jgi:type IX secretion system PorP/SprF family membrane protein
VYILKKSLIAIFLLHFVTFCMAQQKEQYTLYMFNRYQVNPAYAGMDFSLSVTAAYRTQWLGINKNPVNQHISAHMPLYIANGAVGFQLDNEYLGAEQNLKVSLSYNYVYDSPYGLFSAGIKVGIHEMSIDGSLLRTPEGIYQDGQINHNDPILSITRQSSMAPLIGIGAYFINDYAEGGISIDNILSPNISLDNYVEYKSVPTLSIVGEYHWYPLEILSVNPTFLLKSDFRQVQFEYGVYANYDQYLIGGINFRGYSGKSIDSGAILAGMQLSEKFRMIYAFDIPFSKLANVSQGSHEIQINYNLNKRIGIGLPPKIIYNPRY